jgi:hypothetical protein
MPLVQRVPTGHEHTDRALDFIRKAIEDLADQMATTTSLAAKVDPTNLAERVSIRPIEHIYSGRVLGHYRWSSFAAPQAWAGGAYLGGFRYTDASSLAVLLRVFVNVTVATAITAQRVDPINLVQARSYTAAETTNANTTTITGANQRARTASMGTSNAVLQMATAAAGMTGGTRTLDANGASIAPLSGLTALGSATPNIDLYKWDKSGADHPYALAANEGVLIQWGGTGLATGSALIGIGYEWAEVAAY